MKVKVTIIFWFEFTRGEEAGREGGREGGRTQGDKLL